LADVGGDAEVEDRASAEVAGDSVDLDGWACGRKLSYGKSVPSRSRKSAEWVAS
jgi:hypothetical protein